MTSLTGSPNSNITVADSSTIISPLVQNVPATVAGTEYSITLPALTKQFKIAVRNNSKLQISYIINESGANYFTVWPGFSYEETNIAAPSLTLYFQVSIDNEIIEVLSWT